MTLAAKIDLPDPRNAIDQCDASERRAGTRTTVGRLSTIRDGQDIPHDVIVEDLSLTGFRYRSTDRLPIGTPIRLGLAGAGTAAAQVVRVDGDDHGCAFDPPLSPNQLEAAFTSGTVIQTPGLTSGAGEIDTGEPWPRAVRTAIFIGGGAAAWVAVVALLKALS
ncbi:PilZ domain-containing protein [Sphingomonas radiodurans]|uniref:PilZ domain-containing protein n=1 Tax=Sphingomonas radiodurans TaxID=2890321 RepID=UPI001E42E39B|nr:PilZ domain-containing protein [Sphingomonas radiodurans]WBH17100.1 PilZ domain-containing protein [Sphingomonas radiodurans]